MAADALVDHLLPLRTNHTDGCVVEVDPLSEFGVEEEGAVVLAVVGDQSDQLQDSADVGTTLTNGVENLYSVGE